MVLFTDLFSMKLIFNFMRFKQLLIFRAKLKETVTFSLLKPVKNVKKKKKPYALRTSHSLILHYLPYPNAMFYELNLNNWPNIVNTKILNMCPYCKFWIMQHYSNSLKQMIAFFWTFHFALDLVDASFYKMLYKDQQSFFNIMIFFHHNEIKQNIQN